MSGGEDARAFIPPDEDLELDAPRTWRTPASAYLPRVAVDRDGIHRENYPSTPTDYPVELATTPKMAAEMERCGWRPPAEVIATEEDLIALPDGSVVLTKDGLAWIYFAGLLGPTLQLTNPFGGSVTGWLPDRFFPAQLLWRAEEG